ncbi:radical SAM protein [Candidatus Omnitrophota bacterium]
MQFQRPGRYLGKEWGQSFKKPQVKDLRVCLAFPESYEVGMSNLGFRIIHDLFGAHDHVSCERCFMPYSDLEEYLRTEKRHLFSLETKTPLKDFDVVAFCLNYELNFLNFLKMLELGGIEVESEKRNKPLVIIGGMNNPEPVARFIDAAFLGEFEESSFMFIESLRKTKKLDKKDTLDSLLDIPGVYIPSLYHLTDDGLKPNDGRAPFPLTRTYVTDLNKHFYPKEWPVPYIAPVFDRLQVELQRGCPHQCKFCQAHCIYYPYRERQKQVVIDKIKSLYRSTGYEVISLLGLSVIDYSQLTGLLTEIIPYLKKRRVSLSIPSLRPTPKTAKIIEMLTYAKKPGITVALEAGNDRLRRSIGKDIDLNDCLGLVSVAAGRGYKRFKFYFMIGLPGETNDDVLSIADTLEKIAELHKKERGNFPEINASISYFIPKPFSGFEQHFLEKETTLKERETLLKQRLKKSRFIKLHFPDFRRTLLEYLISRSDRRIAPVLEEVLRRESKQKESFLAIDNWLEACDREGLATDLLLRSAQTLPRHIQITRDKPLATKS